MQACFGFGTCDYDRTMQTNWFSDTDTSLRLKHSDCACTHMCACMFCLLKMLTAYQCVSVRVCACMCHSGSQSVISSDGWGWHCIYRTGASTRTFRLVAVDGFDPIASPRQPVVVKLLFEWLKRKKVGTRVIFNKHYLTLKETSQTILSIKKYIRYGDMKYWFIITSHPVQLI